MGFSPSPSPAMPTDPSEFGLPTPESEPVADDPKVSPEATTELAVGTLDYTRLGIELRNAIEAGHMRPADIHMWTSRPWLAYGFLVGRIDKNIVHKSFLDGLREWDAAGVTGPQDEKSRQVAREQWAKDHPDEAQKVTDFVRTVSARLDGRLQTYEKVQAQLHEQKEIATTDKLFFKARDMLKEHPVASIAALIAGGWILSKGWNSKNGLVKGAARLTTLAAAALGIGAAYGGGRQYFGMEPLEWLADRVEKLPWGGSTVANGLRSVSDTLSRGPKLASERDFSALNFFHDKFDIHGMDEEAFFNSLCEESPREFLQWYDNVRTWKLTKKGNVPSMPPKLQEAFRTQVRLGLVPKAVAAQNKEEQANILLRVAEKTMNSFKGDREAEGMDPVAFLEERYVTGEYFTRMYDEWAKEWTAKHGEAGAHVLASAKAYAESMRDGVAKSPIKMLDIFMIHLRPQDFDKLATYGPGGKSLKEMYDNVASLAAQTGDALYEGLGWSVNFATIDVPSAATRLYDYYKSGYAEELAKLGITEELVEIWLEEIKRQSMEIQQGIREQYEFSKNTVIWKFVQEHIEIFVSTSTGNVNEFFKFCRQWFINNTPSTAPKSPQSTGETPTTTPTSPQPAILPSQPNEAPQPAIPPSPTATPESAIPPSQLNEAPQSAIPPSQPNTTSQPSPTDDAPRPAIQPSPSSPQNPQPVVRNPFRSAGS